MGSEHCGVYSDSLWVYVVNGMGWLVAGIFALVGHINRVLLLTITMYLLPVVLVVVTYVLALMRY